MGDKKKAGRRDHGRDGNDSSARGIPPDGQPPEGGNDGGGPPGRKGGKGGDDRGGDWKRRLVLFLFPLLIAAAYIGCLFLLFPPGQAGYITGGMVLYSFSPAGPEILVPAVTSKVIASGGDTILHPALVATSLAFVDMIFAMFFMWNFDLLLKIPLVGPWMGKVERVGRAKFKKNPWVHRFALVGLTLYTMVPFQGSGGAVGSILGRMLGMGKRPVFAAITIGAFGGAFPFAYLTYFGIDIANRYLTGPQMMVGGILIFVLIVCLMIWLYLEDEKLAREVGGEGSGDGGRKGRKPSKDGISGEKTKKTQKD